MSDYITDDIDVIAKADCLNYIIDELKAMHYDVNYGKINNEDIQIAYKAKQRRHANYYLEDHDINELDEELKKLPHPTRVEVIKDKINRLKAQIEKIVSKYSPNYDLGDFTSNEFLEDIRHNVLRNTYPTTPFTPSDRDLIRRSLIYLHFKRKIDNYFELQQRHKKIVRHTKEILMKNINYNVDKNAPFYVKLFDDLYKHFTNLVDGKREKSLTIDERLKAAAKEHINAKRSKMTQTELENNYRVWWQSSKRTSSQLYKVYSDEYDLLNTNNIMKTSFNATSKFNRGIGYKTANKQNYLRKHNQELKNEPAPNVDYGRFPLKQNLKQYQLHVIAPRHSFIIDLMFENNVICYLVAVNINTRKLFVEPTNISEDDVSNKMKSTTAYLNALKKIMKKTTIKYIRADGEKAFDSINSRKFYANNGIEFQTVSRQMSKYPDFMQKLNMVKAITSEPSHSSLGIIDRVIRTIRDLAFNLKIGLIEPNAMEYIVNLYNNAPHNTLSKYAGMPITPNDVDNDEELERFIVRQLHQKNYNTATKLGYDIFPGTYVKVYNERSSMAKRRNEFEPGKFKVVGRKGPLFEIIDENSQKQNEPRYISRYKLSLGM